MNFATKVTLECKGEKALETLFRRAFQEKLAGEPKVAVAREVVVVVEAGVVI